MAKKVIISVVALIFVGFSAMSIYLFSIGELDDFIENLQGEPELLYVEAEYLFTKEYRHTLSLKVAYSTYDKKTERELQNRPIEIESTLTKALIDKKTEEFKGKENLIALRSLIKEEINKLLTSGEIEDVWIQGFLLQ